MTDFAELESFYLNLLTSARQLGVACGITSGMACVAWGVSPSTQDCDILVSPDSAEVLLKVLDTTEFRGCRTSFRGSLSPPLSRPWLRGGWTCHFHWGNQAYLDVFGMAPRASRPWQANLKGLYVSLGTVAEMKKTNRPKDWPFATALALKMLTEGDEDGWLHLGDADLLTSLGQTRQIPEQLFDLRPLLRLASLSDPRLEAALFAEQLYWQQLDRIRLQCFQAAVKPYAAAIRDAKMESLPFHDEQIARAKLADLWLPPNPLAQLGFKNFVDKAKTAVGAVIQPWLFEFLPDVTPSYGGLFDLLD